MNIQRLAGGLCVVAGTAILAGIGWAFLVAGALLLLAPRDALVLAVVHYVRRAGVAFVASRQRMAAAAMPLALAMIGIGLALALGVGWGMAAVGSSVGALSLYVDRAA